MPIADPSADELSLLQDEAVLFTREASKTSIEYRMDGTIQIDSPSPRRV